MRIDPETGLELVGSGNRLGYNAHGRHLFQAHKVRETNPYYTNKNLAKFFQTRGARQYENAAPDKYGFRSWFLTLSQNFPAAHKIATETGEAHGIGEKFGLINPAFYDSGVRKLTGDTLTEGASKFDTFQKWMDHKLKEQHQAKLDARGRPEEVDKLLERVQKNRKLKEVDVATGDLGIDTNVERGFSPSDSSFSRYLSSKQGNTPSKGKK